MMLLICYDGSTDAKAAIEHAGRLAPGQSATVLTVWEPLVEVLERSGALALWPDGIDFDETDAATEQNARKLADEGAELARGAGLRAEPHVRNRDGATIAATILAEAEAVGADAIVLGTRGLTGVKSLLAGSVSHAVMQHADRPVVVVPGPELAGRRAAHRMTDRS